jgi:hypothetical protein
MRFIQLLRKAASRLEGRPDPSIVLTERGFDLVTKSRLTTVRSSYWRNVRKVHCFKYDLITTDCVCLLFEFENSDVPIQVSEEWVGFDEFAKELPRCMPAIPESWYRDACSTSFDVAEKVLYSR